MKPWEHRWKRRSKIIGAGGKATTFTVIDINGPGNDLYLLKLLHAQEQKNSKSRSYFRQEVEALEALDHPRLPRILDHNTKHSDDKNVEVYFVATYFSGDDLTKLVSRRKPTLSEAVNCVASLCEILDYCHRNGVLHRDIKPGNVIGVEGVWSDPALVDFGLSFVEDLPQYYETLPEDRLGNAFFRLPEHQSGAIGYKRNAVSDVTMAAGLLLFFITGEAPGALSDGSGVPSHKRKAVHDALSLAGPEVAYLEPVFDQAFQTPVPARIRSALDLRDRILRSVVAQQPVQIRERYHQLERDGLTINRSPDPVINEALGVGDDLEQYRGDPIRYANWIFLPTVRAVVAKVDGLVTEANFSAPQLTGDEKRWAVEFTINAVGVRDPMAVGIELEPGHNFGSAKFFSVTNGDRVPLTEYGGSMPPIDNMSVWLEEWLLDRLLGQAPEKDATIEQKDELPSVPNGHLEGRDANREQPPRKPYSKHWNSVNTFSLWQAAWLWVGAEPIARVRDGSEAYPVFSMLKTDARAGELNLSEIGREGQIGSWSYVTREELERYAKKKGQQPQFLLPRTNLPQQAEDLSIQEVERDVSLLDARKYHQRKEKSEEYMPLLEAARAAYEELRACGNSFHVKMAEQDSTATPEKILEYFSIAISLEVDVFGKHQPSTRLEKIDRNEYKSGMFSDGGNTFKYYGQDKAKYVDNAIKRTDLEPAIEKLKAVTKLG